VRNRWHGDELSIVTERSLTESSVHGEYLALADVADDTGLGDRVPFIRDDDVNIEHLTWARIAQVLGGRPDARSLRCAFHCRNGCPEGTTAKEKSTARGVSMMDRQVPPPVVMGAFETKKRSCIHARDDPTHLHHSGSDPRVGPGVGSLHG